MGARTADHWNPQNSCYRRGQNHLALECQFCRSECQFYKKIGHIEKICRSKLKQNRTWGNANQTQNLSLSSEEVVDSNESPTTDEYSLYHARSSRKPIMVTLKLNGAPIAMELDTGAGMSIVSKQTFDQLWQRGKQPMLQQSSVCLSTYTGEKLPVLGVADVVVEYKQQSELLKLNIVEGISPRLFERDWLQKIQIDWPELHNLSDTNQQLDRLF